MKIVLIGPSGCGKTTIINSYMKEYNDFSIAKNLTTRCKRHENDNEFVFVNHEEFINLIEQKYFFEYEHIFNNYYGTPKENLEKTNVFFNVDIKGAIKLQKELKDIIVIFIITPSRSELIERLNNRKCNSNIEKRLERIDEEIQEHHISNYKIVNYTVTESITILRNIIEIEQMRKKFDSIIHTF